ncbi:MAG: hypothetical protein R2825_29960 [Saprospiraceae bacterium]
MKKLISLLFIALSFILHAEELPFFEINCNLRNADYILKGKILDEQGKIAILYDYSQEKIQEKEIIIEEFGSPKNFAIDKFYNSLIGHTIIIFVKFDSVEQKLKPAWWGWELSTLWKEGESLKSVIQPENPGGWELMAFYNDLTELEIQISNWDIFNKTFWSFKNYDDNKSRVDYLYTIFKWHPFKAEIIREINKEKEIAAKYLKNLIWDLSRQRLPTKAEICECGWIDWEENVYLELFSAFKETVGINYQKEFSDFISSLKNMLDHMKYKRSEDINERFIIEFLNFMNINPVKNWEEEKEILREIAANNSDYYNDMFAYELMEKLK